MSDEQQTPQPEGLEWELSDSPSRQVHPPLAVKNRGPHAMHLTLNFFTAVPPSGPPISAAAKLHGRARGGRIPPGVEEMPFYACYRGDCANVALERPGCFVLQDGLGRNWLCVETRFGEAPAEEGAAIEEWCDAQGLANKHGLNVEGSTIQFHRAPDVEALGRKLVLENYPPAEESADKLRDAGWLQGYREDGGGQKVHVSVSNGRQTITAEGDNQAEAWYRVTQKVLQEDPPMTPTIQADPAPLRADEGGAIRVGGSQVLLDVVIREYEAGADPESIVHAYPTLQPADVYATIAYYLRHKGELDDYLQRRRKEAAELRQEIEGRQPSQDGLRAKLEARRTRQEQDHAAPRG